MLFLGQFYGGLSFRAQNRIGKTVFLCISDPELGDILPSPGFCVWCRVGARASHTRYCSMTGLNETIPRLIDFR
jgi:hypothetical protein